MAKRKKLVAIKLTDDERAEMAIVRDIDALTALQLVQPTLSDKFANLTLATVDDAELT